MINKSIVVIVPCCGRGVIQAIRLQKELETNHLTYQLVQTKPRNCPQIIEKYGIQEQVEKRVPYIYIDDLCFAAEKINDKSFVAHLIFQLKEIDAKAKGKELEEKVKTQQEFLRNWEKTQQEFLRKIETKRQERDNGRNNK